MNKLLLVVVLSILFLASAAIAQEQEVFQEEVLSKGNQVLEQLTKDYFDTIAGSSAERFLRKAINTLRSMKTEEEDEAVQDFQFESDVILETEMSDTAFGGLISEQLGDSKFSEVSQ